MISNKEEEHQFFQLNWFHIYNAIKHELCDTVASSFMDVISDKTEYNVVNDENVKKILTELKQKRKNPNEIEYIKQLIDRAMRFQPISNSEFTTYSKNNGISNGMNFKTLDVDTLCDIYNVHKCFLFSHYQFTHYRQKSFSQSIQNRVSGFRGFIRKIKMQNLSPTFKFKLPQINLFPQYIIDDDMYDIWRYFIAASHIVHKWT
eukprot:16410_1